jgi:hypothetical protein
MVGEDLRQDLLRDAQRSNNAGEDALREVRKAEAFENDDDFDDAFGPSGLMTPEEISSRDSSTNGSEDYSEP